MSNLLEIPVDFGNCDEDGAVRLITRGTLNHFRSLDEEPSEGLIILMSDGELTAEGTCTYREGMWVAVINRWLK